MQTSTPCASTARLRCLAGARQRTRCARFKSSMGAMSQIERQPLRVAAIYARVSSERQREGGTIESQVAGLHELAQARGLVVPEQLVFLDEGFSGAMLLRNDQAASLRELMQPGDLAL